MAVRRLASLACFWAVSKLATAIPARMPMIEITTRSSIKVKPLFKIFFIGLWTDHVFGACSGITASLRSGDVLVGSILEGGFEGEIITPGARVSVGNLASGRRAGVKWKSIHIDCAGCSVYKSIIPYCLNFVCRGE